MAIYAPWLPTLGDQGSHADWKKSQELLSPLDHWIPGFRWLHPHFCCLKSYHISIHPPLIWATSAVCCLPANFFLELLQLNSFLCAASTVRFATSSCEPPKHKNSIMVKNYLLRSFYQAFSNLQLQLQSRLPGASQHHSIFCCAQPCQCVLSPVENPHSRSVVLNRPRLAQRWQWGRFRATPRMPFFLWLLCDIELSAQSCSLFADLIFQKCSGVVIF